MRDLEKLLEELGDHIAADPLILERLNSFIQESRGEYLKAERMRRDRLAVHGTTFMLYSFGKISKSDISYLIDAVKYIYPLGYPENASKADFIFLDKFVKALIDSQFVATDYWIESIKEFRPNFEVLMSQYEQRQLTALKGASHA